MDHDHGGSMTTSAAGAATTGGMSGMGGMGGGGMGGNGCKISVRLPNVRPSVVFLFET